MRKQFESVVPDDSSETRTDDHGSLVTFESFPGIDLALQSLDPRPIGSTPRPELRSVKRLGFDDEQIEYATVYIPYGQKRYFLNKIEDYLSTIDEDTVSNRNLIESIQAIRRATIRELWTDSPDDFPVGNHHVWWEVWLRSRDGHELERLADYAKLGQMPTSPHQLGFGDRIVTLVYASVDEISQAIDSLDDFAELRKPPDVAAFLANEPASVQQDWVDELRNRIRKPPTSAPAACLIDTGVQQGHPLLSNSLPDSDVHVINPNWGKNDLCGHGTEMAGLALYGSLVEAMKSSGPIVLHHGLESVKILRDCSTEGEGLSTEKDVYGAVTAAAVDRPEIERPNRSRVFLLTITSPAQGIEGGSSTEPGKPTSWSAAIDALAAGRAVSIDEGNFAYLDPEPDRHERLFIVSAGNIREMRAEENYLDRNDVEPVEDPSQAWNALTVGAFTEMDSMSDAVSDFAGYVPLAHRGDLSPSSRTSLLFDSKRWPVKPDIVAEGGNYAKSPDGRSIDSPENLAILTTRKQFAGQGLFTTTRDTSAASAQIAALAANVMAEYPDYWPETIRGLVVHSAEWTTRMCRTLRTASGKDERRKLIRRYGMGVPDLSRALHSASNSLTLVSQSIIKPFQHDRGNDGTLQEMNVHNLPWPTDVLQSLGATEVRMRVTLSYFVEPNPSRRGWTGRYLYPSHGLRFAVRRAQESAPEFRARINHNARTSEESQSVAASDSTEWLLGVNHQQSAGSLHSDIWTGSAADLANRGMIAVYPVAGWWKFNKTRDRSEKGVRYSLIVSIDTPSVEADVWTPVFQQIESVVSVTT